tara:strand:- start:15908 stop:17086 length:1179 start_codon:yes stop_codon:yes gene_type:complete
VALESVSDQASSQERIAAFDRLRSAALATDTHVTVSGNNVSASVTHSLVLANGDTVYHSEDILPILNEDTPAARKAREAQDSASSSRLWFLTGIAALTLGAAVGVAGIEATVEDDDSTVFNIGLGLMVGSVIPVSLGYYYGTRSGADTRAAFATYDESLLSSLKLCVEGGRVQDCAGGSVANHVLSRGGSARISGIGHAKAPTAAGPASAAVGAVEVLQTPDAATGTTSFVFRYTAAPGITLKFATREMRNGSFGKISVSVICEGLSEDQFTDESMLALVLSKDKTLPVELTRRVNQLRVGVSQEIVEGTISPSSFLLYMGQLESLEFRVGTLEFALPTTATERLADFGRDIGNKMSGMKNSTSSSRQTDSEASHDATNDSSGRAGNAMPRW